MSRQLGVERALGNLQRLVRNAGPPTDAQRARTRRLPRDLWRDDVKFLVLSDGEVEAMAQTANAIHEDLRFEHIGRRADEVVWRFVCNSYLDKRADHLAAFLLEHGREPETLTCFFPIEGLTVAAPTDVLGCRLFPPDDPVVPHEDAGFRLGPPIGSVLAVECTGTELGRMADRAGATADHVLRVMRVALHEHRGVGPIQLRFRRDIGFSFGGGLAGWKRAPDDIVDVPLDDRLTSLIRDSQLTDLPLAPRNDIERKALLALRWIERAQLATDPLEGLLFHFFALEALLGDRSEGLKAQGLAFRRALLNVAQDETFSDPNRVYLLYDRVRSAAVHGEMAPDVDREVARNFAADVRQALHDYLDFARTNGITRRGQLLKRLDEHPLRDDLVRWLHQRGGPAWRNLT